MKALLIPLALCCLPCSGDEIRTQVRSGAEVRVEVETRFQLDLGPVIMVHGGKRSPYGSPDSSSIEGSSQRQFVDRIISTRGETPGRGRRAEVERTFGKIRGSFGDLDPFDAQEGVLEGRTLHMFADDERPGALPVIKLDDAGESVAERYLQGFRMSYPEERLLPEGDVRVGAKWLLDGAAVLDCLGLDVGIDWFDEQPGELSLDAGGLLAKGAAGDAIVTYAGSEVSGEETIARFEFTFDLRGDEVPMTLADFIRAEDDARRRLEKSAMEVNVELEGKGSFLMALESGRLLESRCSADAKLEVYFPKRDDGDGMWFELEVAAELENERSYTHSQDDDEG